MTSPEVMCSMRGGGVCSERSEANFSSSDSQKLPPLQKGLQTMVLGAIVSLRVKDNLLRTVECGVAVKAMTLRSVPIICCAVADIQATKTPTAAIVARPTLKLYVYFILHCTCDVLRSL